MLLVQVVDLVVTLYEHTSDAHTLIISSSGEIGPAILLNTFVAPNIASDNCELNQRSTGIHQAQAITFPSLTLRLPIIRIVLRVALGYGSR